MGRASRVLPPPGERAVGRWGTTYRVWREPAQDLEQGFVHLIRCPLVELPAASHKQCVAYKTGQCGAGGAVSSACPLKGRGFALTPVLTGPQPQT